MYRLLKTNEDFLIISKNPGIPFHKGNEPVGLVEKIRNDLNLCELFPVHRLDTITSGIILFAKHRTAAQELARQFRTRMIEKFYLALAPGTPKKKQGTVKGDMIKGRNGAWILAHTIKNPAITQFFSAGLGNGLRLYILKPRTGRTHQLRVMMKSISVPILGDPNYYNAKKYPSIDFDRGYLHAFSLRFTFNDTAYEITDLPTQGIHFQSDEFILTANRFKEPWNLHWPTVKVS